MVELGVLAIFVLLVGAILGTAKLVRTLRLKLILEEQERQYRSNLSELRSEIADLRGSLAKMTERLEAQTAERAASESATPTLPEANAAEQRVHPVLPATLPSISALLAQPQPLRSAPVSEPPRTMPPPLAALGRPTTPPMPPPFSPPASFGSAAPELFVTHIERPNPSPRAAVLSFKPPPSAPPRNDFFFARRGAVRLRKELRATSWAARIAVGLLFVFTVLFGKLAFDGTGSLGKAALLYAVAVTMLWGGICLEGKPEYQLLGRTAIAGGWVLAFLVITNVMLALLVTTNVLHIMPTTAGIPDDGLAWALMLIIAISMMVHTWRYKSQIVTGLSFLLAFATVALSHDAFYALSHDSFYALSLGPALAIAIVAVSLQNSWFGLEVLGILSSYLSHFCWLWRLRPSGIEGRPFPEFWPSVLLLVLYWLIFHVSYVARGARSLRDERMLAVAAMLNTLLLLIVMRYQSNLSGASYFSLVGLGALEFYCAVRVRRLGREARR